MCVCRGGGQGIFRLNCLRYHGGLSSLVRCVFILPVVLNDSLSLSGLSTGLLAFPCPALPCPGRCRCRKQLRRRGPVGQDPGAVLRPRVPPAAVPEGGERHHQVGAGRIGGGERPRSVAGDAGDPFHLCQAGVCVCVCVCVCCVWLLACM